MDTLLTRFAGFRGLAVFVASLLFAASCGGSGDEVELARKHLRHGDLVKAERALASAEGSAVERLRKEVRLAKEEREEFLAMLDEACALNSASESVKALKALSRKAPDTVCQERLDLARSQAADRAAGEAATRPHRRAERTDLEWEPVELIVEREGAQVEARSETQRAQVALVFESVVDSRARKQWELALIELEMVLPSAGSRAEEIRTLAKAIEEEAQAELGEILARGREIEDAEGAASARSYLLKHTGRFPGAGSLSTIHDELARVTRKISRRNQAERRGLEVVVHGPKDSDIAAVRARAASFEAAGELRKAMDAWIDAGFAVDPGDERDSLVGRARALERRLLFREEVAVSWESDSKRFTEKGYTTVSADAVEQGGEAVAWSELSGDELQELGRLGRISEKAKGGLLLERLATGSDKDALADLGRWVERGHMRSAEAWGLVAASLGEEVPEGGYAYDEGQWVPRMQFEAERLAANLDRYKKEFLVSTSEEREDALARLLDLGSEAEPAIEEVMLARWERASRTVQRGGVLDSLKMMASRRKELDQARSTALELIFDEEEYFYPYTPPECPPDRARLYPKVQRQVDELVNAVREEWDESREVHLPAMFLSGLDDLFWLREVASDELDLSLTLEAEIPNWIWGIDSTLENIQLKTFAWDADEAFDLAMSRNVVAYNEHLWKSFKPEGRILEGGGKRAEAAEAKQVRITNEYREMMGRRAVAWNPQLQAGASMHSEYMSDTGDFGHFERGDPRRRSPSDRVRLCGYKGGASENCSMGSGSPQSAHDGWLHSSGHHRNILGPRHQEMGSGVVGNYWTQNFGSHTGYMNDLLRWRD